MTYRFPEPERKHMEALADEIEPECGAVYAGYSTPIPCEAEAGHVGRHYSVTFGVNWPAG